jgi:hypothetical protein
MKQKHEKVNKNLSKTRPFFTGEKLLLEPADERQTLLPCMQLS